MPSPAKNNLFKSSSDFQNILSLCNIGDWKNADEELKKYILKNPDQPEAYVIAAHVVLRQGNVSAARWLVNKAQAMTAESLSAQIEDICIDFYEAHFESAYRKIFPSLLKCVPKNHPIYAIAGYLCCLYNDAELYKQLPETSHDRLIKSYLSDSAMARSSKDEAWNGVEKIIGYLKSGDKLNAGITARYTEIFFPAEADSFAALGMFNMYAGFYQNAARNFHEAIFKETSFSDLIESHRFYLFSRQQKFAEAVEAGLRVEERGVLDVKGQGFFLEMMMRGGHDIGKIKKRIDKIEGQLSKTNQVSPYIEIMKLRLQLLDKPELRGKMIQDLKPHADHSQAPEALLYFYAELLAEWDMQKAKIYALRALVMEPFHPDAERWEEAKVLDDLNFEYAGLFIPKEHEGGAWPTETQMELLEIIFLTKENEIVKRWNSFAKLHSLYTLEAGAARLLPMVHKKFSKLHDKNNILEAELLSGIWKKSYFENALRMKNILAVVQQLEARGVEVILLKGMANALALYDDIGSRPMSDIDILIPPAQLQMVDSELRAQGWFCKNPFSPSRLRFNYAVTYHHNNGTIIDVHWCPCESLNGDFYDPADIGKPEFVQFMGKKLATLSPTVNLLCTILHGVEWNHLTPVRWVSDALLIMQKFKGQIDWKKIYDLAEKYHCLHIVGSGLQFLARFNKDFVSELPVSLHEVLNKNYENDILMKIRLRARNHLASFDEAFAMLEYVKKRFAFNVDDHLFICGGDDPEGFKTKCAERVINWASHYDSETMLAVKRPAGSSYNFVVINANLSCSFQCMRLQNDISGATQELL